MDASRLLLFSALAVVIGVLIPLIGLYVPEQNIQLSSSTSVKPRLLNNTVSLAVTGGLENFEDYTRLYNYLSTHSLLRLEGSIEAPRIQPLVTLTPFAVYTIIPESQTLVAGTREGYAAGPVQETSSSEYSTTNVQVRGVDEPDYVKTNGEIIVVAGYSKIYIVDPFTYTVSSTIGFEGELKGLFLYKNLLVVLSSKSIGTYSIMKLNGLVLEKYYPSQPLTLITVFDVSDPYNPSRLYTMNITGSYLDARLEKGYLYIVTSTLAVTGEKVFTVPVVNDKPLPPRNIVLPGNGTLVEYYNTITSINVKTGEYSAVSILSDPGSTIYMKNETLIVASTHRANLYMEALKKAVKIIIEDTDMVPLSERVEIEELLEQNMVIQASQLLSNVLAEKMQWKNENIINEWEGKINNIIGNYRLSMNTTLYFFHVKGLSMNYVDSKVFRGVLRDQFCIDMDDHGYLYIALNRRILKPVFRINTYNVEPRNYRNGQVVIEVVEDGTSRTVNMTIPSSSGSGRESIVVVPSIGLTPIITDNVLYVIDTRNVSIVSSITRIAVGEDIKAARLLDGLFLLVTYRRIDPLFAVNISDPKHPEIIGWLHELGYSEYLHPLPGGYVLGVGVSNSWGLKIEIYDLRDPRHIKPVSILKVPDYTSPVLRDYHAFLLDMEKMRIIIPIGYPMRIYAYYAFKGWNEYFTDGFLIISLRNHKLHLEKAVGLPGAGRALYIDDKYYLISPSKIQVINRDSLEDITVINLS